MGFPTELSRTEGSNVSFACVAIDQISTMPTSARRYRGREIRVTNGIITCPSRRPVDEGSGEEAPTFLHLSAQIGAGMRVSNPGVGRNYLPFVALGVCLRWWGPGGRRPPDQTGPAVGQLRRRHRRMYPTPAPPRAARAAAMSAGRPRVFHR